MLDQSVKMRETRKQTVASIVLERIRDAIVGGLLPPGSHIDQMQLAADLKVSLVPVREALKKLEGEGFVHIIPRRGAFVAQTSLTDMRELYFAREVLEGQAAFHSVEQLTDADLAELSSLAVRMAEALRHEQFAAFLELDRDFHFTIYRCSGSHYLTSTIKSLWELAERYRFRLFFYKDHGSRLQAEHEAILNACCAFDREALRTATTCHVAQTFDAVRGYLIFHQPDYVRSA
jgi:DNA-binding GntR family transcriptional regulator